MLRVLLWAACASLLPVLAWTQTAPHHSVGIFMDFDSALPVLSLETMESEVDELLKASGVSLDWRLTSANRGEESFAGLVVLKFKGACRVDGAAQTENDFGTLGQSHVFGATKVSHGHVLPFSEVKCDQVRQALSYLSPTAGRGERQTALGRALGRVVAHELYHILARTTRHAAEGLAKASQSMEELISVRNLDFREEDSRAIGEGVREQE